MAEISKFVQSLDDLAIEIGKLAGELDGDHMVDLYNEQFADAGEELEYLGDNLVGLLDA